MAKKLISIHSFCPASSVRVTGEDAFGFLQGQFTNDLRAPAGSVTYGLWLNQKGKVLADSEILRIADRDFLLTSEFSAASVILPRLEQYIIADDVVLEDQTPATSALGIVGKDSADLIREMAGGLPVLGSFLEMKGARVLRRQDSDGASFILIGPTEIIQGLRTTFLSLGCTEATVADAEFARIASGIPRIPNDIGPTDLPQEAGLETTAISFTKGCYLGQEVMARLKSMGQVRRHLLRVRGIGPAPLPGAVLFQSAKKVGDIRSVVATEKGFVAMAMLTRMGLDETAGFSFEATSGVQPVVSIWMK